VWVVRFVASGSRKAGRNLPWVPLRENTEPGVRQTRSFSSVRCAKEREGMGGGLTNMASSCGETDACISSSTVSERQTTRQKFSHIRCSHACSVASTLQPQDYMYATDVLSRVCAYSTNEL
jgi:hypothetical protein